MIYFLNDSNYDPEIEGGGEDSSLPAPTPRPWRIARPRVRGGHRWTVSRRHQDNRPRVVRRWIQGGDTGGAPIGHGHVPVALSLPLVL